MKKMLSLIVMLGWLSSAHAGSILKCATPSLDDGGEAHLVAVGGVAMSCYDENAEDYRVVELTNVGPGLKAASGYLTIACTSDDPTGTYVQAGASCALLAGAEARICLSARKGACSIIGSNWGLGGEISVGKLVIYQPGQGTY